LTGRGNNQVAKPVVDEKPADSSSGSTICSAALQPGDDAKAHSTTAIVRVAETAIRHAATQLPNHSSIRFCHARSAATSSNLEPNAERFTQANQFRRLNHRN
jgi:hypothetical protein